MGKVPILHQRLVRVRLHPLSLTDSVCRPMSLSNRPCASATHSTAVAHCGSAVWLHSWRVRSGDPPLHLLPFLLANLHHSHHTPVKVALSGRRDRASE